VIFHMPASTCYGKTGKYFTKTCSYGNKSQLLVVIFEMPLVHPQQPALECIPLMAPCWGKECDPLCEPSVVLVGKRIHAAASLHRLARRPAGTLGRSLQATRPPLPRVHCALRTAGPWPAL